MRIRPGKPRGRTRICPEDFWVTETPVLVSFEEGIKVVLYVPRSKTFVLENDVFCVVSVSKYITRLSIPFETAFYVCQPWNIKGREVVFHSPIKDKDLSMCKDRDKCDDCFYKFRCFTTKAEAPHISTQKEEIENMKRVYKKCRL